MIKQSIPKTALLMMTLSMIFLFYPIMGMLITLSPYYDDIYLDGVFSNLFLMGVLVIIVVVLRGFILKQAKIDKSITVSEKTFYKITRQSLIKVSLMTLMMYILALSVVFSFYAPINYLYLAVVNVSYVVWFSKVLSETKLYNPFDTIVLLRRKNKEIYVPIKTSVTLDYFIER